VGTRETTEICWRKVERDIDPPDLRHCEIRETLHLRLDAHVGTEIASFSLTRSASLANKERSRKSPPVFLGMCHSNRRDLFWVLIPVTRQHHLLNDGEVRRAVAPVDARPCCEAARTSMQPSFSIERALEFGPAGQPQLVFPSLEVQL
jgi:hypothetical protein